MKYYTSNSIFLFIITSYKNFIILGNVKSILDYFTGLVQIKLI